MVGGLETLLPGIICRVKNCRISRLRWSRAIRAAISRVNAAARREDRIPDGASAYSYRHARISELLQVYGVDPLTVAQQTGTSIAMIEKAYMRFIPVALQQKLAALREA